MKKKTHKDISAAELSSFCGQAALILEAGLPLYDGMEILARTDSTGDHALMYQTLCEGVARTGSLYEALRGSEGWPAYLVGMTGIGERSGRLDQVMREMERSYAREERIRSSLRDAVTYPLSLGALLLLIILVMLLRVVPVFRHVLESMGLGAGDNGVFLMNAGTVLGWVVLCAVGLMLAGTLLAVLLMRTTYRERIRLGLRRLFPPLRHLYRKISACRLADALSMLLRSGFQADEALKMAGNVLDDPDASRLVDQIRRSVEEGTGYADALSESGLFDELDVRMLRMGIAAGREDQVLSRIAGEYEEQIESEISRLIGVTEPALVALLCLVVGAVLLSVMLPMAGILSGM
ncbi:MAG: type II secretion system F family protein [Blautia sp.]|nr:type II secretion system F family protein [Blautia sp.]